VISFNYIFNKIGNDYIECRWGNLHRAQIRHTLGNNNDLFKTAGEILLFMTLKTNNMAPLSKTD
jgi:hypothetical protein